VSAGVDILNPDRPKRIVIVASNPAVSEQTGGPIGFWWAELVHPFLEFREHGYEVDIASPDGGPLEADSYHRSAAVLGWVGRAPDDQGTWDLRCSPIARST